jgi:hypothetical protein
LAINFYHILDLESTGLLWWAVPEINFEISTEVGWNFVAISISKGKGWNRNRNRTIEIWTKLGHNFVGISILSKVKNNFRGNPIYGQTLWLRISLRQGETKNATSGVKYCACTVLWIDKQLKWQRINNLKYSLYSSTHAK